MVDHFRGVLIHHNPLRGCRHARRCCGTARSTTCRTWGCLPPATSRQARSLRMTTSTRSTKTTIMGCHASAARLLAADGSSSMLRVLLNSTVSFSTCAAHRSLPATSRHCHTTWRVGYLPGPEGARPPGARLSLCSETQFAVLPASACLQLQRYGRLWCHGLVCQVYHPSLAVGACDGRAAAAVNPTSLPSAGGAPAGNRSSWFGLITHVVFQLPTPCRLQRYVNRSPRSSPDAQVSQWARQWVRWRAAD